MPKESISPYAVALHALRKAQRKKGKKLTIREAEDALHSMGSLRFSRGTTETDVLETLHGWHYISLGKKLVDAPDPCPKEKSQ